MIVIIKDYLLCICIKDSKIIGKHFKQIIGYFVSTSFTFKLMSFFTYIIHKYTVYFRCFTCKPNLINLQYLFFILKMYILRNLHIYIFHIQADCILYTPSVFIY